MAKSQLREVGEDMKILLAQLNYQIGNIKDNTQKILSTIEQYGNDADLIVFSELCITGYYPRDLLYQRSLIEQQNEAIEQIKAMTTRLSAGVVIGYVDKNLGVGKPYFNALGLIDSGALIYRYSKQLLPVYNIFDEARHFEPGKDAGVFDYKGETLGFLICEDAWENKDNPLYSTNPIDGIKNANVDLIVSINASPSNTGKQSERFELIKKIATDCSAPVAYVNQVGGCDDIIFDGGSLVIGALGECLSQGQYFLEDTVWFDSKNSTVISSPVFLSKMELISQQLKLGLADYCQKTGFDSAVVGCSGGIDSAVTIALAVSVFGADKVQAITMPSQFSSEGSWTDSEELCANLGINLVNYPIKEQFEHDCAEFEAKFGERPSGLTQENLQARSRAKILMAYSNNYGNLVLSTGNKSEMSVGYCTLGGDMMGGLSVLGDLYKMEVYAYARFLNDVVFEKEVIPSAIIDKEPSAELSPDQKDSDSLPTYPILDAILHLYIEEDYLTNKEKEQYEVTLKNVSMEVVNKVKKMVRKAEYKRQQAAPVLRVHPRAFGIGRQIPLCSV
ncbi:MAG: NAD+ synthase (glutamine-hydrolyzing) [Pseudohongiellaceae bacterium]